MLARIIMLSIKNFQKYPFSQIHLKESIIQLFYPVGVISTLDVMKSFTAFATKVHTMCYASRSQTVPVTTAVGEKTEGQRRLQLLTLSSRGAKPPHKFGWFYWYFCNIKENHFNLNSIST